MRRKAVAALAMLVITAAAGLLLRTFHLFDQLPFGYIELRHAHSHLGFLGWVFPMAMVLIDQRFGNGKEDRITDTLFWLTILVNLLMFVSFLIYGYERPSIILLSIHTVLACFYAFRSLSSLSENVAKVSRTLVQLSMLIMGLSFLGPIAIPIIKSQGAGPDEFKLAVHFYLHFQYNGFFVLVVLALLSEGVIEARTSSNAALIMGIIGTYFLTVGWYFDSQVIMLIGLVSAVAQLVGGIMIFQDLGLIRRISSSSRQMKIVLASVIGLLAFKWLLQGASPFIADLDVETGIRMWTVAYLHLVFLGVISPYFIMKLNLRQSISQTTWLVIYAVGFILTETALVFQGFGSFAIQLGLPLNEMLICGSVGLLVAVTGLLIELLFQLPERCEMA